MSTWSRRRLSLVLALSIFGLLVIAGPALAAHRPHPKPTPTPLPRGWRQPPGPPGTTQPEPPGLPILCYTGMDPICHASPLACTAANLARLPRFLMDADDAYFNGIGRDPFTPRGPQRDRQPLSVFLTPHYDRALLRRWRRLETPWSITAFDGVVSPRITRRGEGGQVRFTWAYNIDQWQGPIHANRLVYGIARAIVLDASCLHGAWRITSDTDPIPARFNRWGAVQCDVHQVCTKGPAYWGSPPWD